MIIPSATPRMTATAIAALRPVESPFVDDDLLVEFAESAVPAEEDEVVVALELLGATEVVMTLVLVIPFEVMTLVMVLLDTVRVEELNVDVAGVDEGTVLVVEGLADDESGTLLYIVV